jgi:hypothetical protein
MPRTILGGSESSFLLCAAIGAILLIRPAALPAQTDTEASAAIAAAREIRRLGSPGPTSVLFTCNEALSTRVGKALGARVLPLGRGLACTKPLPKYPSTCALLDAVVALEVGGVKVSGNTAEVRILLRTRNDDAVHPILHQWMRVLLQNEGKTWRVTELVPEAIS